MNYSEGTWFAVPLRSGGFGLGVVARATAEGGVILAYLFGPRRATIPTLADATRLDPLMAVKVARIGDLNLITGAWPIIGQSPTWHRGIWSTPTFIRSDELSRRAWKVRYADDDPNQVIAEEPVAFGTATLDRDVVFGAGAVELVLAKLLHS